MKHLSPVELVDFIEGTLAESRAAHVSRCDDCRRQADDLRLMLAEARDVEVPEPSPLFWDRFSGRVSAAVAVEPERRSVWGWLRRPAPGLAAALAAAMVILAIALWPRVRGPVPEPQERAARRGGDASGWPDMTPDDASWELVTTLASDLAWEEAEEAGFAARPGAADRALLLLNEEERSELVRLLETELPRAKS